MEGFGHHVDRQFFRRHLGQLVLSACVVAAVLIVIGFATGVGLAILGGAFCFAMMAMMAWMMVGMVRGHGQ